MSGRLPETEPRVAIFVDYENVKGPQRIPPHVILGAIKADVRNFGVLAYSKVYLALGKLGDQAGLPQAALYEIYRAGGEPVVVPSFVGGDGTVVKSMVDPELICDLMESLHGEPAVTVYCLASGDKDMLVPLRRLHKRGKAVRLYAPASCASILRTEVQEYADPLSGVIRLDSALEPVFAKQMGH